MTRRELATFITGAVIGGALLAPLTLSAQDHPGATPKPEQGCGGCCEGAAPAPAVEPAGCCDDEAAQAGDPQGQQQAQTGEQASLEAWMAAATPSDAHRKLDALVGTWTATSKMWMEPGAEPMESTGITINTWDLGGRFLEQRYLSTLPCGTPFEGHGFTGFDNCTQRYFGVWFDTMSTGALASTGCIDAAGKVMTFHGEAMGPNGVAMKYRHTLELAAADRHVFTLYQALGDGPELKAVEITYTRR